MFEPLTIIGKFPCPIGVYATKYWSISSGNNIKQATTNTYSLLFLHFPTYTIKIAALFTSYGVIFFHSTCCFVASAYCK